MAFLPSFAVLLAVTVVILAIGVAVYQQRSASSSRKTSTRQQQQPAANEGNVTYVIGDLHGDAECGQYWIDRLNLVVSDRAGTNTNENEEQSSTTLKWANPRASLVFLGDYVDKGPHSLPTLQLVQRLTTQFPQHVTALLGNHELELLRDRHPSTTTKYLQLAFSAVHPEDYLHYLEHPPTEDDYIVIDTLLNASLEIYARRLQRNVLTTSIEAAHAAGRNSLLEVIDPSQRPHIQDKVASYQQAYLNAFASNTTLGHWLETRKIVHVENGIVFCHGGLNEALVKAIVKTGGVDAFNEEFQRHANDETLHTFLQTKLGKVVYNIVVYRGNHEAKACPSLPNILRPLNATKLAVGHTPGKNVRSLCQNQFWALDSLLGRWIRTSGNQYCPVEGRSSQTGGYVCPPLTATCQGQVTKFDSDGNVEIIR